MICGLELTSTRFFFCLNYFAFSIRDLSAVPFVFIIDPTWCCFNFILLYGVSSCANISVIKSDSALQLNFFTFPSGGASRFFPAKWDINLTSQHNLFKSTRLRIEIDIKIERTHFPFDLPINENHLSFHPPRNYLFFPREYPPITKFVCMQNYTFLIASHL